MIRLFASDLDGTLMNEQHTSDDVILGHARNLMDQGYILATATGRPPEMLHPEQLPGFYYICMNGALILDPDLQVMDDSPIDPQLIAEMYEQFEHLPLEFCSRDKIYSRMDKDTMEAVNLTFRSEDSGLIPVKDIKAFMINRHCSATKEEILAQPIYKVNCMHTRDKWQDEFEDWLKKHEDQLDNAQSLPVLYEITAADVNKAYGVKHLAGCLGFTEDECAVFGDGGNDLDMLKAFEASFAPCTGSEEAKKAARHVIGPYTEYSVILKMAEIAREQDSASPEQ